MSDNKCVNMMTEAAKTGDTDALQLLLNAEGADPNQVDSQGDTALTCAAQNGHLDCVKRLLLSGSDLELADRFGYTALIWAACGDHVPVLQALHEAKANVNHRDSNGWTALMWAACNNKRDAAAYLLNKCGADATCTSTENYDCYSIPAGSTALSMAQQMKHDAIVKLLMDKNKAKPKKEQEEGRTNQRVTSTAKANLTSTSSAMTEKLETLAS